MTPKPEHRISAIEKRVTHVETDIEELASDQAEQFKMLSGRMHQGFDQAHAFVQERFAEIKHTLTDHTERLDRMESIQVEHGQRLDRIEGLLLEILARLPKNTE